MSDVIEEKQFRLDWLKWLVVAILVAGAIYGNWYYSAESVLYRVLALVAVFGFAALIATKTQKGERLLNWLQALVPNGAKLYGRQNRNVTKQP